MSGALILAGKELRDARRNRWFLLYTVGLAVLALAFAGLGASGLGELGVAGFGRTTASLINLVMLVVPLMGLTLGALAIAGERERGTLLYLLAQPVTTLELYAGKLLGLGASVLAALLIGFGLSGALVATRVGRADAGAYLALVGLAFLLGLACLSLGLLLSTLARRSSSAVGLAVFVWLGLVFLGDLGVMGTALVLRLGVNELTALALVNPLQVFKVAAVLAAGGSLEVLGPAGLYLTRTYGAGLLPLLLALLAAWTALPALGGYLVLRRRGAL
ncbi:MAG: ABC transporter permease [Planctomycetes bacterium]|nr:ABC transporter permease [Planctomycetota bacterium]